MNERIMEASTVVQDILAGLCVFLIPVLMLFMGYALA